MQYTAKYAKHGRSIVTMCASLDGGRYFIATNFAKYTSNISSRSSTRLAYEACRLVYQHIHIFLATITKNTREEKQKNDDVSSRNKNGI